MINLLSKIHSTELSNPNLAEKLMCTLSVGYDLSEKDLKKCQKIWQQCNNDRSTVLKKIISLCGNIDTPQTRYLKAKSWAWNKVEYCDYAIESLEYYLNNPLYEKIYTHRIHNINDTIEDKKNMHLCEMNRYLAQSYEKKQNFEKALEVYNNCFKYDDMSTPNIYLDLANIYRKMNRLNQSINILEKAKKTKYYKGQFKQTIDIKYDDYIKKINNNYVYRSRKK